MDHLKNFAYYLFSVYSLFIVMVVCLIGAGLLGKFMEWMNWIVNQSP